MHYNIIKPGVDTLGLNKIKSLLSPTAISSFSLELIEKTASTNSLLLEKASSGAADGTLVIADSQTGGRGRLGKSFCSPSGTGIYMSVLLRPDLPCDKFIFITTAAAVAVCRAIEKVTDKRALIKWVNDIYIDGKKVCGILTEAVFNTQNEIDRAVLGIGLNVYEPSGGFPDEISGIAGAVLDKKQVGARNLLIAEILNAFADIYSSLESGAFLDEYRKRCFIIGRRISVISSGTAISATALGVDDSCRLVVRYDNGTKAALSSGEISLCIDSK